jgi:hypothetical protein
MGEMPEKIASGADAQAFQRLCATLADSLEELDGGIETKGGRGGARGHPL